MPADHPPICDYEGSDYQTSFWDEGGREYEDGAEAMALARLLPPAGERMLEIGAGAGRNTPRFAGFGEVTLLDYSRSQLERARSRLGDSPRYRYVAADVYRMPFAPGVFDGATMIRTLHHMQDPAQALAVVREAVTDGGVFVLEYANKRNLKAVFRWLVRRQAWNPFDHTPFEFARLNYDFHPAAVRGWLSGAMFHVEREVPVSHLRLGLAKQALPTRTLLAIERPLQRLGRAWLFTPSVFVRTRASGDPLPPAPFGWRCPDCKGRDLAERTSDVTCRSCGRAWPVRDGIYDFRVDPGR